MQPAHALRELMHRLDPQVVLPRRQKVSEPPQHPEVRVGIGVGEENPERLESGPGLWWEAGCWVIGEVGGGEWAVGHAWVAFTVTAAPVSASAVPRPRLPGG